MLQSVAHPVIDEGINSHDEMVVETTPSLAIFGRIITLEWTTWLISSELFDPWNRCGRKSGLGRAVRSTVRSCCVRNIVLFLVTEPGIETPPR